ncbi:MAG: extracellular solute-binding protein, partial [Gorillibacterium sp.]|nr:extracellular solute-binding protein [Gorillibacterium sp.]
MNKRKVISVLVALTVLFSAACSNGKGESESSNSNTESTIPKDPLGKYEQTVTLNIAKNYDTKNLQLPDGDTLENNGFSRYVKEKLNVEVKLAWQTENMDAYNQKVGVAISSQDLPDAFIVNEQQLKNLVKADLIADLTDVYKDFVGPLVKGYYDSYEDRLLSRATFDGKLYALPDTQIAGQHTMTWIRQDWLDKLKLKAPTTVAELEAVAKAFIEQDPDGNSKPDTIGFTTIPSLTGWNTTHSLDPIFGAFNAYKGQFLKDASGDVVYSSTLPEMKTALAEIQKMYKMGIIDK